MEGIMMRYREKYAVAVRTAGQEIVTEVFDYRGLTGSEKIGNIPVVRGMFRFAESLVLGMRTLEFSASFFEEEDEAQEKKAGKKDAGMGLTVAFAIVLAVGIFMVLPYYISVFFQRFFVSQTAAALLEGAVRLAVFIGYVAAISLMPDIRRVYMYHGAEHKCINCIERGLDLNVENVKKCSRQHRRCGTSFLLTVMLVSIVFFLFIRAESGPVRLLLRILFVPVIAGVSYEFIRLAGRTENAFVLFLGRPGMWLQNLTTREPDDSMIEVGIASVEAVFDWRSFVEQIRQEDKDVI